MVYCSVKIHSIESSAAFEKVASWVSVFDDSNMCEEW